VHVAFRFFEGMRVDARLDAVDRGGIGPRARFRAATATERERADESTQKQ
jgi:hypothetical protein